MSEKTLNDWQVAATALKIDGQAFNEMATILSETLEDYDFKAEDIAILVRGIQDRMHIIVTQ